MMKFDFWTPSFLLCSKIEFQTFNRSYSQLTFSNFSFNISVDFTRILPQETYLRTGPRDRGTQLTTDYTQAIKLQ